MSTEPSSQAAMGNILMISMHMETALEGFNFEITAGKSLTQEHTLQLVPFKQLCTFITFCHQMMGGNLVVTP